MIPKWIPVLYAGPVPEPTAGAELGKDAGRTPDGQEQTNGSQEPSPAPTEFAFYA